MPPLKASVQEIKLGALYKFGVRRLDKASLVDLLVGRVGFKKIEAERLAAHWLTTEPYRKKK